MARIEVSDVVKRYGSALLFDRLDFDVADGEFMVIIGPSGCGKSTLLRIIAGIEEMDGGSVLIGEADVSENHPGDRDVAMVFQDYALYPHMTVEQNLSFGLRARHERAEVIREKVQSTADALGLAELLKRRPHQLSGGQRQRVALGRAMIREPRAYLMDEPLSNLDANLRVQMRAELIEFHRRTGGTILYVTHDQAEAMTMGERIAVMSHGRLAQIGTPEAIYRRPADTFVAGFLGSPKMNFVAASAELAAEAVTIRAGDMTWTIDRGSCPDCPDTLTVGFRPEAVAPASVAPGSTDGAGAAVFARDVNYVEHLGHELVVHLVPRPGVDDGLVARVHTALPDGAAQQFVVPVESVSLFEPAGRAVFHGDELGSGEPMRGWSSVRR